jgi:beta-N-acetylhexosaminidase
MGGINEIQPGSSFAAKRSLITREVTKSEAAQADRKPLSLREKCELIVITGVGFWTTEAESAAWQRVGFGNYHIYGGMKFSQTKLNQLHKDIEKSHLPPSIVTMDKEGGTIGPWQHDSVEGGIKFWLGALAVRATPADTQRVAELMGRELSLNGINLNLAPMVDLQDADRPIDAWNYQALTRAAALFVKGMTAAGVGTCAKHFPDGSKIGNTHKGRVADARTKQELKINERYKPLIAAGVPAIMMSHVVFQNIDPAMPATLSKMTLAILRQDLGFKGLIITDAMEMKAISVLGLSSAEAAILAFEAGADLILGGTDDAREIGDALYKAVRNGRISESRLDETVARIQEFSDRFPIKKMADNQAAELGELQKQAAELYASIFGK